MTKNLSYIGIAILVILAGVLGYIIYQQATSSNTTPTNQQTVGKQDTTQKAGLTADDTKALNFPGPNATEAEKKAHSDLVNKLGDKSGTPYLDISGCRPTPIVYRVKQSGTFKVKNSDAKDHTINTDRKTIIKANSEQTLTSKDIGDNLGNYEYGCDGSAGSGVGVIQIVP